MNEKLYFWSIITLGFLCIVSALLLYKHDPVFIFTLSQEHHLIENMSAFFWITGSILFLGKFFMRYQSKKLKIHWFWFSIFFAIAFRREVGLHTPVTLRALLITVFLSSIILGLIFSIYFNRHQILHIVSKGKKLFAYLFLIGVICLFIGYFIDRADETHLLVIIEELFEMIGALFCLAALVPYVFRKSQSNSNHQRFQHRYNLPSAGC